jgi:3-hydroxybutyryl-CoA dehydratase
MDAGLAMSGFALEKYVGLTASFRRTVSESDVYLFAGITGDHHRNHTDEEYMRTTVYGSRIAAGAMLVGFMSRATADIATQIQKTLDAGVVTYGFDRVRFTRAVCIGDTIEVRYRVASSNEAEAKLFGDVEIVNQRKELVCVAKHISKIIGPGAAKKETQ